MNRLFRPPYAGLPGYAALGMFAAAYITVLALVLAPEAVVELAAGVTASDGP